MKYTIKPGKYVLAVSGGVDSMVLLDALARDSNFELVVAHFDHGIRPDSAEDRLLVARVAAAHNLPYIYDEGKLGAGASEAMARHARYDFLERARQESGAQAIITAHHQDDLLETMALNILRGTGRKGLTSLQSTDAIIRPLLHVPKAEIRAYAEQHNLAWREDSTNGTDAYLRNRIRRQVMPKLTASQRTQFISLHSSTLKLNTLIDLQIAQLAREVSSQNSINKLSFIMLPHNISLELMAHLLRVQSVGNIDRRMLDRLVTAAKTARIHSVHDVDANTVMIVDKKTFQFVARVARKTR